MISVIVPVYKVEPYLQQCVDSILNQSYRDLEVLLIDDGSPDKCGEICDEYEKKDKRVRVFHTENRGLSAARNLGLREAKGDYIGFIDSDDWIEPDMYEVLLRRVEETGADISICGFICENGKYGNRYKPKKSLIYMNSTQSLVALITWKMDTYVWNKLYTRATIWSITFPESRNYEDIACMHMILERSSKVATISEAKYHHRIRENSITETISSQNLFDFADAYISRYLYFEHNYPFLFKNNKDALLKGCILGIGKVWVWIYRCSNDEKSLMKIEELREFAKQNLSFFIPCRIPIYLRMLIVFLKHNNRVTFALLYYLNYTIRKLQSITNN